MPDIVITVCETGIRSVDAELTPKTGRKTLQFLERIFPELEQLNLTAQSVKRKASSDR